MDDATLIESFRAGDEAAFAELVSRHRLRVYRVTRGILRRHDRADEAAQEAFVKVYQSLPGFRGESSFSTWLHRIARNAALDLLSRESTQDRTRVEAAREAATTRSEPSRGPRALEQLILDERREALRAAIAGLPERQRLTLTLRVQQGLKFSEIAETLGCPVGTVKANVHHAVQNLKKTLAPEPGRSLAGRER